MSPSSELLSLGVLYAMRYWLDYLRSGYESNPTVENLAIFQAEEKRQRDFMLGLAKDGLRGHDSR